MQQAHVQLVDVRTSAEWNQSHIPGAMSLPITQFTHDNVQALKLDKEKEVILICLSAHRSIPAVRKLKQQGFDQAAQLRDGMVSWWKAKNPT